MKIQGMKRAADWGGRVLGGLLLLGLAAMPAMAQPADNPDEKPPGAVGFDTDRQIWLFDTDGDGFPDLTEQLGGTDPSDSSSNPLALAEAAAGVAAPSGVEKFQFSFCQPNFWIPLNTPVWAQRLCISNRVQGAVNLTQAIVNCRVQSARVCSYEDLAYLYLTSDDDPNYDPYGKWLGDWVSDDVVNVGNAHITFNNDPDIWNFEGEASKWDPRPYWCCHNRT